MTSPFLMTDQHPQSQGLEERGKVKMKEIMEISLGMIDWLHKDEIKYFIHGYKKIKLSNLYTQGQLKS